MNPYVALGMVLGRLFDMVEFRDLGEDVGEKTELIQELESATCAAFGEDEGEFVEDALRTDDGDLGGELADGGGGCVVDGEAEARGEANGAEHALLVFRKALQGISDGAEVARNEVSAA